jgi:hypothetical protein
MENLTLLRKSFCISDDSLKRFLSTAILQQAVIRDVRYFWLDVRLFGTALVRPTAVLLLASAFSGANFSARTIGSPLFQIGELNARCRYRDVA